MHSTDPENVDLLTPLRSPEAQEPLYLAGQPAPKDMTLDYKTANPEGE